MDDEPTLKRQRRLDEEDRDATDARAAARCVRDGDLAGALRFLQSKQAFATREVIERKIPLKFPCSEQPTQWPDHQIPASEADKQLIRTHMRRACAQAVLHRAPGLGGSRGEHWKFQAESDEYWTPVAHLLIQIAKGNVEKDFLEAWHSGRTVCLAKGTDDMRPTIIAPWPARLVEKAVARAFQDRVRTAVGHTQFCMQPGGAELMHKAVHTHLTFHDSASLHSWDIRNAHYEVERGMLAHAIEDTIPELAPWVRPLLKTSGWLTWTTDGQRQERQLDRGLKQGGPLSNLLFPIAMARPVKMAEAVARQADMRATIACYQDDVNVVASPHAEALARATFIEEMRKIGLVVHKLSVFTPSGRQPHPDKQLRQDSRALILRHGAPCPVPALQDVSSEGDTMTHSDSPEVHQLLSKRAGMTQRLLQLRDAGLPTQFALAMFRYAIAGDATFLARTCGIPPRAQFDLDHITTRTACALLHADDITETTRQRIFLPTRLGGLGMWSAITTARAAFTASWIATLGKLRQWTQKSTQELGEQLPGLFKSTPNTPMRPTSTLRLCTPWPSRSINARYPR